MKKLLFILSLLAVINTIYAQKYMSRNGHIEFLSKTPMETIEGKNNQVASTLNAATGDLAFAVLVKSFEFKQALLQEHFNENYLESDKYPRSMFKGKITNISAVNFQKDGTYPVNVEGQLTIHNVTKDVKSKGTVVIKEGKVSANSNFSITPTDYGIIIPSLVKDKIAKQVDVKANVPYEIAK
jgi:polyisoprenoid-binding protein YceI